MAISISPIVTPTPYSPKDEALLNKSSIETSFDPSINYIEYVITDIFNSFTLVDYQYNRYSFPTNGTVTSNDISSIDIDPTSDFQSQNLNVGDYIVYYNFYQNELLTDSNNKNLFIKDISSDRTELVVKYNSPYVDPSLVVNNFNSTRANNFYFQDFYLNFGDNNLVVANNITVNSEAKEILINLYDALPSNIDVNDNFWVVTKIADSLGFNISIIPEPYTPSITSVDIKGPNFNLPIKDQTNNSTGYLDYTTALQIQSVSSSNQLKSLLAEKGIDINIDYTDFNNFIHFSSAYQRLTNFYYKVSQIESLNNQINSLVSVGNSTTTSDILKAQVTNIIENFDDYDYYLYYGSGSWAWPKSTSTLPYTLYSTGSSQVINWLGSADNLTGILGSASIYDENNQNSLYYSIPEYIRDDERNEPYYLFIEMVGQYYDNIWTYYKDVTNLYVADNRLDYGISKDLVAEALKSFGLKIYQNNYTTNDLYSAFLGYTTNNSEVTRSLPVTSNSGQEYINNYITASYKASTTPLDDYNKEIYKRLYHNLPYLSKTKGTIPGLRALINCFGIPDTILRISEFGGRDKDTSTYDYFDQKFNYAAYMDGVRAKISSSFIIDSDFGSYGNPVPQTIQFRFKPDLGESFNFNASQSLFYSSIPSNPSASAVVLRYEGTRLTSGSYSGSSLSPDYQYGKLFFYPNCTNINDYKIELELPFFNGEWWSVMVTVDDNVDNDYSYTVYAGSKGYYDGYDGNQILYYSSSSLDLPSGASSWKSLQKIEIGKGFTSGSITFEDYIGYVQELRYWGKPLGEEAFKDFVMNPSSIDYGGGENNYSDYLAFRVPLGNELYTGSKSIHPKITGSWSITQSFNNGTSNLYTKDVQHGFTNIESFFYDQPITGIKNRVTDKIQIVSSSYPTGSVLSQYRSIEQTYPTLGSETPDINLLEVAFSPQNEINNDIISSLGYFNIGEYIGDPRQVSSSSTTYPDLVNLSNNFFQKYFASYDLFDYIRLIKYFDNSLFKMLQDFVPARTSLASGVVIKQHLLERNKYPQPQLEWEDITYSGSITTAFIDGGTGGTFNSYNFTGSVIPPTFINNTQSWLEPNKTPYGLAYISHSTQDEFYNGELPGTELIVEDGELNEANTYKHPSTKLIYYNPTLYVSNATNEASFTDFNTSPNPGEVYLWWDSGSLTNPGNTLYVKPTPIQVASLGRAGADFLVNKTNGVKYIKIHSVDSGGLDQSNYLRSIQNLTLKYPDRSDVTYPVVGIQELSSYFLYSVGPYAPGSMNNFNTSSVGDINNYTVSFKTGSISSPINVTLPQITPITFTNYNITSGNTLGYFTASSGVYLPGQTPNPSLTLSGNFTYTFPGPPSTAKITFYIHNGTIDKDTIFFTKSIADTGIGGAGVTFNSSTAGVNINPAFIEGSPVYISLLANASGVILDEITFSLGQLPAEFNGSSSLTLIDPYVENFDYSEYNALLNNVDISRPSTYFMDVDYSQNPVIPVNQSIILSGSADKALVPDSNYTSKSWSNIRYNGTKYNSIKPSF